MGLIKIVIIERGLVGQRILVGRNQRQDTTGFQHAGQDAEHRPGLVDKLHDIVAKHEVERASGELPIDAEQVHLVGSEAFANPGKRRIGTRIPEHFTGDIDQVDLVIHARQREAVETVAAARVEHL